MWEISDYLQTPSPLRGRGKGEGDIVAAGFSLYDWVSVRKIRRLKPAATILTLLILLLAAPLGAETGKQAYQHIKVTLFSGKGQFSFDAEVARNQEQFTLGLMHRQQLGGNKGMLFIFPDVAMRYFWMKNTLIPLDIIFISESKHIAHIAHQAQPCPQEPCPVYDSQQPAKYVVEINGGLSRKMGLKIGDKVEFK